jgi:hypothetical protein
VSLARHPQLHIRLPAWRSRVLLVLVLGWLAALAGRAFYLQGLHHNFLQQKGESRHMRVLEVSANRGMIRRPQQRAARHLHAGGIGDGRAGGRRMPIRRQSRVSRACSKPTPGNSRGSSPTPGANSCT